MSCHRRFRWYSHSVMALQLASVPASSWLNTLLPDVHSSTATQWLDSFIGFQTWLSRRVTYDLVLLFQNPWGQDATVCVSESLSSEVFVVRRSGEWETLECHVATSSQKKPLPALRLFPSILLATEKCFFGLCTQSHPKLPCGVWVFEDTAFSGKRKNHFWPLFVESHKT